MASNKAPGPKGFATKKFLIHCEVQSVSFITQATPRFCPPIDQDTWIPVKEFRNQTFAVNPTTLTLFSIPDVVSMIAVAQQYRYTRPSNMEGKECLRCIVVQVWETIVTRGITKNLTRFFYGPIKTLSFNPVLSGWQGDTPSSSSRPRRPEDGLQISGAPSASIHPNWQNELQMKTVSECFVVNTKITFVDTVHILLKLLNVVSHKEWRCYMPCHVRLFWTWQNI